MDVLRECRPEEGASQPSMEVLVETLTGTAFEMTVSPSDTIFAIKSKIFRVEGIPISQQHLLYNLKELDDASSLREHAIGDGARLRLVLGMRGGPISTRRLPPPAPDHTEPWPDIERLLDSTRDEGECASGGSGCKVTVLVFRDGERVNMLRVRENHDGTYSPLDNNRCFTESLSSLEPSSPCGGAGAAENAVTQGKMMEIRRRMEMLSLQRHSDRTGPKGEIQKTRSEETLSVPSLLSPPAPLRYSYSPEHSLGSLLDGTYTRYEYDCAFSDRFTLPPLISPIGTRPEQEEEVKLSDTLAGSILVKREEGAILEECIDSEECRLRPDSQVAKSLQPIPAADYGGGGGGVAWGAAHSASASSLALRPPKQAVYSSSTSDLEKLKRNSSRILPALSRHRPREHLHLSDEALHLRAPHTQHSQHTQHTQHTGHTARPQPVRDDTPNTLKFSEGLSPGAGAAGAGAAGRKKPRVRCGLCHKRLSCAAVHTCRCGAVFCAPHRYAEVHGCAYDYKAGATAHPVLQAPKLPKI